MGRAKNGGWFAEDEGIGDSEAHNHSADDVLSALLQNLDSAVVVFDGQGRFVEATDSACRLFGLTRDELLQLQIADTLDGGLDGQAAETIKTLLTDGEHDGVYRIDDGSGQTIELEHSSRADILPGLHMSTLRRRETYLKNTKQSEDQQPQQKSQLSSREKEIMTLLALGENNQTIAKKLFLAPETVRHYTRMARIKLGAKSRSHAIALAVATGQIDRSQL